ncbi:MAG: MobA/MobL family protein [Clostridia bacterium]|nr:MobA/MobL family protein [Clostridia bacterium]
MAIYHFSAQVISRGKGRCVVAAAAYRSAERLYDERTGLTYDYTKRRTEIESEILVPENCKPEFSNREKLWNAVEASEKRSDSQLAREINIAIPVELEKDQQKALVREYVKDNFVDKGMIADISYHHDKTNPHVHIMLTMREVTPDGFSKTKNRQWNDRNNIKEWREKWSEYANRYLEMAKSRERIDHRNYKERGIEKVPQIHMGPKVYNLKKKGVTTRVGDIIRQIKEFNRNRNRIIVATL